MDLPKISIIIPVYNVELFLEKCLTSVLNQTFKDFELILINDGSTDNSADICKQYKKIDNRIKLYHIDNSGVSHARNYGIVKSSGEYLCFVDSDDWISETYLQDFFANNGKEVDLHIQGYDRIRNDIRIGGASLPIQFSNMEEMIIYCEKHALLNSPCFKLFKRDLVISNALFFDTRFSLGEDHIFTLSYLQYVETFSIINTRGYFYRISSTANSLTTKLIDLKSFISYIKITDDLRNKLVQIHSFNVKTLQIFLSETNKWILFLVHSLLDGRRVLSMDKKIEHLNCLISKLKKTSYLPGNSLKSKIYNAVVLSVLKTRYLDSMAKIFILTRLKAIITKNK